MTSMARWTSSTSVALSSNAEPVSMYDDMDSCRSLLGVDPTPTESIKRIFSSGQIRWASWRATNDGLLAISAPSTNVFPPHLKPS